MANYTTTPVTILPDLVRVSIILPIMDRYMLMILYISGIIGSLLNIITLSQKQFRNNPCSLYFLSASTTDLCIMNLILIMDYLRYFNYNLLVYVISATIWCQLGKYFTFLLPCLASTYITLACIDRFCTSSDREKFRKFSRIKVSRILIVFVLLIWILFSIHLFFVYYIIFYIPTKSYQCIRAPYLYGLHLIVDGYIFSMFNGLIVPIILAIFSFLIYRNVRQSRTRVVPMQNSNTNRGTVAVLNPTLNRYNLHLTIMLMTQSSLTMVLNIPYMTIYLYSLYSSAPTNQYLLLIYYIFTYIGRWFWYANYSKTFYINTLSSRIFRKTLKKQFISFIPRSRLAI